jgi:hypothetical protein
MSPSFIHLVGYGLIVLFALLSVTCFVWYRDIRRTRQGDAEVWQAVNGKKLPDYDGDNYQWDGEYWPPEAATDTLSFPAVPASEVSGEFNVITPTSDADEFIAKMRADTAEILAKMNAPL